MKLLLDTHVLLWAVLTPEHLSSASRDALEDGNHEVYVSVVSAWEIAIKQSLGKLELSRPAEYWLPDVLTQTGFEPLEVGLSAALRVRALPWHHRDPFDRLLLAQAMEGGFTLVTHDVHLRAYGAALLEA